MLAVRDRIWLDLGAYNSWGIVLPYNTVAHLLGPHRVPHLDVECRGIVTTKTPNAPYRGAGRPETVFAMAAYARLADVFGPSRVKELLFTARLLTAEEAHAAGYVHEIVPADQIEARVSALARQIAEHAPITLWVTKESLRRLSASRALPEDGDLIATTYASADFREGVRAFLDKRKPQWTGR